MKTRVVQDEPDERPAPHPSAAPAAGEKPPPDPAGRMRRWGAAFARILDTWGAPRWHRRGRAVPGRMEPGMANVITPPTARLEQKTAARTEDAVKIYGTGKTEVRALDGVSAGFAAGRYTAVMGPRARGSPPCCITWPAWTA